MTDWEVNKLVLMGTHRALVKEPHIGCLGRWTQLLTTTVMNAQTLKTAIKKEILREQATHHLSASPHVAVR